MKDKFSLKILKKFLWAGLALLIVILIGTIVYWFIGNKQDSIINCIYMTVITIATIGYGEIVDLSGSPFGRVFTMFLAFSGFGILTYVFSSFTAFAVEGELKATFIRRKMEKNIKKLKNHFIVCGIEGVGFHIINELNNTNRPCVVVDKDKMKIEKLTEKFPEQIYIEGDATEDIILLKAGIENAKGIFAATNDDNINLVICLSAKQINNKIKMVSGCNDIMNIMKMKKSGADHVISPTFIGGLRMASEMIRPAAVSFLDTMLRDKYKNLRIEDLPVSDLYIGKPVSALNLKKYHNSLLLAIKTASGWTYNPSDNFILESGQTLVIMTTPEEREGLEKNI